MRLGKIKCGVSCRFVWWQTPLLILRSVGIFRLSVRLLMLARSSNGVAYNGKGLCEVRATATESGEEDETLAKTFSIF